MLVWSHQLPFLSSFHVALYREDEKPVLLAKKLIGVAIDLEKKKRYATAFCVFRRAYQVLPDENVKLVERMKLLEGECPVASTLVPSQQMSTAMYMQAVMERDLLEILNTGSYDHLLELPSIGDRRAEKIMDARPFHQVTVPLPPVALCARWQ